MSNREAFWEGRDAYVSGRGCPYAVDTQEYLDWHKGWNYEDGYPSPYSEEAKHLPQDREDE